MWRRSGGNGRNNGLRAAHYQSLFPMLKFFLLCILKFSAEAFIWRQPGNFRNRTTRQSSGRRLSATEILMQCFVLRRFQ